MQCGTPVPDLSKGVRIMEDGKGGLKIEAPEITINYIAETDRETFDAKGFRAEYPELYDDFVKITTVKPSIRIKVK